MTLERQPRAGDDRDRVCQDGVSRTVVRAALARVASIGQEAAADMARFHAQPGHAA